MPVFDCDIAYSDAVSPSQAVDIAGINEVGASEMPEMLTGTPGALR